MAISVNRTVTQRLFIFAVSLFVVTAIEAKAQQNEQPAYPGLAVQPRSHTVPSSNRGAQPDQSQGGYSGLIAAPSANQRATRQNRNAASPSTYGNSPNRGSRVTERLSPAEQQEQAASGPKPVESRFSTNERQLNLIRNLKEQRRLRSQQTR